MKRFTVIKEETAQVSEMNINKERLLQRLHDLAQIGRNAAGGIDRQLGSPADSEARAWMTKCWEQELGLQVRVDAIANLWAGVPKDKTDKTDKTNVKPIVLGSHHDTVPNGGAYDGALGVLMATEVLQTLLEHHAELRHPIELLSFTGEEPNDFSVSTLGSKVLCGRLKRDDLRKITNRVTGEPLRACIARLGGDIERADEALLSKNALAAFIECHIEQGRRLFDRNEYVAAVSCITGIYREVITVTGEANHAGTTLYKDRRDALAAASEVVLAVEKIMRTPTFSDVAATAGRIICAPNASNIVPGRVTLTLDLRTANPEHRKQALQQFGWAVEEIAARRHVTIDRALNLDQAEMPMAEEVITALKDGATAIDERPQELVSMAGHDAANMARLTKAGMLFVQSIDGISHSPLEATAPEAIAKGAQNMLEAVLLLDERLEV